MKKHLLYSILFLSILIAGGALGQGADVQVITVDDCRGDNGQQGGFHYQYYNLTIPLPVVIKYRLQGTTEFTVIHADSESDFIPINAIGTYVVIFQTSYECVQTEIITINSIPSYFLDLQTEFDCRRQCIDLMMAGGIAPYEVNWQIRTGIGSYANITGWPKEGLPGNNGQEDLCDVLDETYKATVYDAVCGIGTIEHDVSFCGCLGDIALDNLTNVSNCSGPDPEFPNIPPQQSCDGAISITIENNTIPYTVSWSGPGGFTSSSEDISGLCTGNYTVTISAMGCTESRTFQICCCNLEFGAPESLPYPLCSPEDGITEPISVSGEIDSPNGAITLAVTGGNIVQYSWTGLNGFTSRSKNLSGLEPGIYCVRAYDGCSEDEECFEIKNCDLVTINVIGNIETACHGFDVGKITQMISGSTPPYKYKWSNGQTSKNISNLPPGTYTVTVTDVFGCTETQSYQVPITSANRIDCDVFCDNQKVQDFGPEITVTNPIDCRFVDEICSVDGLILRTFFAGTYTSYNSISCHLALRNSITDDICDESFGFSCTGCAFGAVTNNTLVSCVVNYCYFPEFDISIVNSTRDIDAIAIIDVPDINGNCIKRFFQVYNSCEDPTEPIIDETIECDETINLTQIDCSTVLPENTVFDGDPFGGCGLIRSEENFTNRLNKDVYFDSIQKLNIETEKGLSFAPTEQIIFNEDEICNKISFTFYSNYGGDCVISILDPIGDTVISLPYYSNPGYNNITINKEMYEHFNLGLYSLVVIHSKENYDKYAFKLDCYKDDQDLDLKIFPNPNVGVINIDLSKFETGDRVNVTLLNNNWSILKSDRLNLEDNKIIQLDISNFTAGSYHLIISSDNGENIIKKIIKI